MTYTWVHGGITYNLKLYLANAPCATPSELAGVLWDAITTQSLNCAGTVHGHHMDTQGGGEGRFKSH